MSARPSRRDFLAASAVAATFASTGCAPDSPPRRARSHDERRDVLVVVRLRGGMDGLTLCVPHGDDALYRLRPTLAIAPPGRAGGALDLDGFHGLAPAARSLYQPFKEGRLAIVHAVGSPHPTRSHFDAMAHMDAGTAGDAPLGAPAGWLARLLAATSRRGDGCVRGIAVDSYLPAALAGADDALAISDPRSFTVLGRERDDRGALAAMYAAADAESRAAARRTFAALERIERTRFDVRQPSSGPGYPDGELGARLALASAWIRAHVGVEVLTVDHGGWDDHGDLGPRDGAIAARLDVLTRALSAFARDLGPELDRVTVVAWSEFGRRVAENASAGLDHGHGGAMLVLGGHVAGGRVHGRWPTLADDALDGGDLAVTTDARDVLAEIARARLGVEDLPAVFPGHVPRFPGVVV